MRTVRDLRDLVNVSRLSYRESDDENDYVYKDTFASSSNNNYSFESSIDYDNFANNYFMANNNLNRPQQRLNHKLIEHQQRGSSSSPLSLLSSSSSSSSPQTKLNLNSQKNVKLSSIKHSIQANNVTVPILSLNAPIETKKKFNLLNNAIPPNMSNVYKERNLLLDRGSLPSVSLSNHKKLPPLNKNSQLPEIEQLNETTNDLSPNEKYDASGDETQSAVVSVGVGVGLGVDADIGSASINEIKQYEKNIQPLKMANTNKSNNRRENEKQTSTTETSSNENVNFDNMLIYIDASVVSEWLNRANRSLRKMHEWHRNNSFIYEKKQSNPITTTNSNKLIKFESFIMFANFWLGANQNAKFDHRQRRQLIDMEYSIITDEVTQAFQVGIDSQQIGITDINRLLKAVFKEYPLQLLSFRGTYLILDLIDILSSNRHDEYKRLLSDVKCRTLNKQHAQWILSIRSFSLINLCWSIIKFYRKTVEKQVNYIQTVTSMNIETPRNGDMNENSTVDANNNNNGSLLAELNGRLSSLSLLDDDKNNKNNKHKSRHSSSSSSLSSASSNSTLTSGGRGGAGSGNHKSASIKKIFNDEPDLISNQIKYDYYLEAVIKHDFPEVLHYLIVTKKCDPFRIDEQGRTLIFLAVINDKPKILNYLVKRWPSIDINEPCDSGNTPLHAAVNKGKLNLVEILLQSLENSNDSSALDSDTSYLSNKENNVSGSIESKMKKCFKLDVNKTNPKCMNATALHLAVWNDFDEISLRLIQSKADPYLKMNGLSNAFELALENSNQVLYELLNEYSKREN